ncbi:MAG TPA: DUF86 domain-containing protein, partial [Patescibacteria group bacterium]|nr:DUF86 domain-containing protein [Patescibacteria group bacterium]
MSNRAIIENKISHIRKYLRILDGYQKYSRKEIEENIDLKGAVERYLYLAVQATIDLSEAAVAYKNFRKPTTMSESFYILNEEKIISNELTEKLVKMTGFRNAVAHDYEKLNYEIVYDVLQNRLKDIEEFIG